MWGCGTRHVEKSLEHSLLLTVFPVISCRVVGDIHSGKTKTNCLKYIVKNVPISTHLTFFSISGPDFWHPNSWTLGKVFFE